MRQYELAIRIAQVHHLVDERKYRKALAVIQTLDMRQIRNISDLKVFAEVFTRTEQFEAAKATYLRIYKKSRTRRVLYRLIYLAIRTNNLDEAESYYNEFVRMNPNARDTLILRYRIDKAKGVAIGQLIDTLKALKEEEYVEEWAYELAKLYHRAGRIEECYEECEDIKLWFGQGEIVERAKLLMEHLNEKDPMPYLDDEDFTEKDKEQPNPDDTGSLPDLNEYLQSNKPEQKQEEKAETERRDEFIDDYESDDMEMEGGDLPKLAKDGIQKLSGLLKFSGKKEELAETASAEEEGPAKQQSRQVSMEEREDQRISENVYDKIDRNQFPPVSQSGTGITQDLAREISAIYEAEHREQLKEKTVTVINELPNLATDVVERMTHAVQKAATKTYIPLDVEEIYGNEEKEPEEDSEADRLMESETIKIQELSLDVTEMPETGDEENADEEEPEAEVDQLMEPETEEEPETDPLTEPEIDEKPEQQGEVLAAKDLPTTRALHRSFEEILILIGGELDPSHFVLMGDGEERIIGVSKRIVRVMMESGYLSKGRIARIEAEKLNRMDLMQFKGQLKGNCLLVDHAAELLFPTITKIFSIMDEYDGDFVVILADEGKTLDQLFRFAPALARRFKYIIDISKYTEKDY